MSFSMSEGLLADMVESRVHLPKDDSGLWVGSLRGIHIRQSMSSRQVHRDNLSRLTELQSNTPGISFTLICAPSFSFVSSTFGR